MALRLMALLGIAWCTQLLASCGSGDVNSWTSVKQAIENAFDIELSGKADFVSGEGWMAETAPKTYAAFLRLELRSRGSNPLAALALDYNHGTHDWSDGEHPPVKVSWWDVQGLKDPVFCVIDKGPNSVIRHGQLKCSVDIDPNTGNVIMHVSANWKNR